MDISNLTLKKTTSADLDILFEFQREKLSNYLAAFTVKDPDNKESYLARWHKIIRNPTINMKTIYMNNVIVGSVLHFDIQDETNVSYWIDRKYWSNGIATKALSLFLKSIKQRPLYGRIAFDNIGSQKVLLNCNFHQIATENEFSNARNKKIEEFIFVLNT